MKALKISVGLSLLFFFTTVGYVFTAVAIDHQKHPAGTSTLSQIVTQSGVDQTIAASPTILTEDMVSIHKTVNDCWLIIGGNVYNVTPFLAAHPGGAGTIIPYCGKEATQAFNTKDKKPGTTHTTNAQDMLSAYLVGPLGVPLNSDQAAKATTPETLATTQAKSLATNSSLSLTPTPTPIKSAASTAATSNGVTLTTSEIASHNNIQNCWLIISGGVYNVTTYITSHPGGVNAIAPYCGKEATNAFQTKGGGGNNHSNSAYSLLSQYFIGNVGSGVVVAPNPTAIPTQPPTSTPTRLPTSTTAPGQPTPTSAPTSIPNCAGNSTYTSSQVAAHATQSNCWMIISGKVYNLSSFLSPNQHPPGASLIIPYCGKDGTVAFNTKGGQGSSHNSSTINNLLPPLCIGVLGSANPGPTSTPVPGSTATPTPVPGSTSTPTPVPAPTATPVPGSCGSNVPSAVCSKYPGATIKSMEDNQREMEVNTASGCRHINLSAPNGSITSDSSC